MKKRMIISLVVLSMVLGVAGFPVLKAQAVDQNIKKDHSLNLTNDEISKSVTVKPEQQGINSIVGVKLDTKKALPDNTNGMVKVIAQLDTTEGQPLKTNSENTKGEEQPSKTNSDNVKAMNLKACIDYALENSLDLQQALLLEEQKEEEQDKADFYSKKLKQGKKKLDTKRADYNKYKPGMTEDQIKEVEEGLTRGEQNLYGALQDIKEGLQDVDSTRDLMETQSDVGLAVAQAGVEIQRKGIALQVRNAYYEVLKDQRMVEVRKAALNRALEQCNIIKAGYEIGMNAKDEHLLTDVQARSMRLKLLEAQNQLNEAKMNLKQLMNMGLNQDIVCEDDFTTEPMNANLLKGIEQGQKKRLEVLKADGELLVYRLNKEVMQKNYTSNTFYVREAVLQEKIADVNYKKKLQEVEASIRNSYSALETTKQMLQEVNEMKLKAGENLKIATAKYQIGFGKDSILLKKMDSEGLSGTIMEVMAAQENVAEVDEAVVNVIYNYNLAKAKYLFDIGTY